PSPSPLCTPAPACPACTPPPTGPAGSRRGCSGCRSSPPRWPCAACFSVRTSDLRVVGWRRDRDPVVGSVDGGGGSAPPHARPPRAVPAAARPGGALGVLPDPQCEPGG